MIENLKNLINEHPKYRIVFYLKDKINETFDSSNQKIDLSQNGIIKIISGKEIYLIKETSILKIHFICMY